jgi:acetyl/propionyl-CoA carboxylase alpha subunit
VEAGAQKGYYHCILYYFNLLDDEISIYYDPMIAKVIAHGQDRIETIKTLDSALSEIVVNALENIT